MIGEMNLFSDNTIIYVKENLSFISFSEVFIDERAKNYKFALEVKS